MGYRYTPYTKDERARSFFGKRGKNLAIVAVVVVLISVFYVTGNTLTGYATYSKNLERQLNNTKNALLISQEQKEVCKDLLESTSSELNSCKNDLTSAKDSLANCSNTTLQLSNTIQNLSSKINNLTQSLENCKKDNESVSEQYEQLAKNSAKPICCSFGDIQSGAIRNWNIMNNAIICSGNYTVNCTSGETN